MFRHTVESLQENKDILSKQLIYLKMECKLFRTKTIIIGNGNEKHNVKTEERL